MKSALLGTAVIMTVLLSSVLALADDTLKGLVPKEIGGWTSDGSDGFYDRDDLFDYIDGAAEVYLAYDYRNAFARRFVRSGQPAITADLFDMGSPEDAYGIFTFERERERAGIGMDSEYASGFLRFWKGRYFVSILADTDTQEAEKAVKRLGMAVVDAIPEAGTRPHILGFLPEDTLVQTSVRYFHRKSGLDYHYFLADKNILNLTARTNVLLARCKAPAGRVAEDAPEARVMVVEYRLPVSAVHAYNSFTRAYLPEARSAAPVLTEDGKFAVARRSGRYIVAVFESPTADFASALADGIIAKIEVGDK